VVNVESENLIIIIIKTKRKTGGNVMLKRKIQGIIKDC
jgi:hypothetical protein